MKRKKYLIILLSIFTLVVMVKLLTIGFLEPWVRTKLHVALNEKIRDYTIEIDKVHILIITSGIELEGITIQSKQGDEDHSDSYAKIKSVKFNGINILKVLFKNDIDISKVSIENCSVKGKIPFSTKAMPSIVIPLNIRIGTILFDKIDMAIKNTSTSQSYSVKEGFLKMNDLQIDEQDTLSIGLIKQFDFEAAELSSVSSDSMYSFTANGIFYSAISNNLAVNSFFIHPNYTDYDFTSRFKFQKDCIEADFNQISIYDFNAADYFKNGSIISSYIEIGKMDIDVFRDNRKEFQHLNKSAFQNLIYNYPSAISIDSIGLIDGNIKYTEHVKKAKQPGTISFNKANVKIFKITNDTIYKTESAFFELKGKALLMGKGKMTVLLKSELFDRHNTFTLNGTLSDMDVTELNSMLENNGFIYASSGRVETMKFNFTANNSRATGKMVLLYHGLDLAFKNKKTNDSPSLVERFISLFMNKKMLVSNPILGEEVREGIIAYERDPERFLFNYCFKAILSGIKPSLVKNPKKSKNS